MAGKPRLVDGAPAKGIAIEADELARGLRTIRRMEGVSVRSLAQTVEMPRASLYRKLEDGSPLDQAHEEAQRIAAACGWRMRIVFEPTKRPL